MFNGKFIIHSFTDLFICCYTGGDEIHFVYKFYEDIKIHCEKQDEEEEENQKGQPLLLPSELLKSGTNMVLGLKILKY